MYMANYKKSSKWQIVSSILVVILFVVMYFWGNDIQQYIDGVIGKYTVVNYVQMTRIRNVQQLLLYTQRKITDIAESCGFTSFSQFNRTFNKFCKISPSEYRQSPNDGERLRMFNE